MFSENTEISTNNNSKVCLRVLLNLSVALYISPCVCYMCVCTCVQIETEFSDCYSYWLSLCQLSDSECVYNEKGFIF